MKLPTEVWAIACKEGKDEWLLPPMDEDESFLAFDSLESATTAIESQRSQWGLEEVSMVAVRLN